MTPQEIEAMPERWRYYYRALHLKRFAGWDHETSPFPGFYRYSVFKGSVVHGVALFDGEDGVLVGLRGYPPVPFDAFMLWDRIYRSPITEAQYRQYEQTGRWWDDLAPAATHRETCATVRDLTKAAPLGPLPKAGRFA